MHQSGQTSTLLRLDPPGLGTLAVHVALSQGSQINVTFIPSLPQTAQLLHAGMDQLAQAMSSAGLTLGQTAIGGQSSNSAGNQTGGQTDRQPNQAPPPEPASEPANVTGLSAYA
jgi:flagellar hook-length control protein FliK